MFLDRNKKSYFKEWSNTFILIIIQKQILKRIIELKKTFSFTFLKILSNFVVIEHNRYVQKYIILNLIQDIKF